MSRRSSRRSGPSLASGSLSAIAAGILLLVSPALVGNPSVSKALVGVRSLGVLLLMLGAGGLLLVAVLQKRRTPLPAPVMQQPATYRPAAPQSPPEATPMPPYMKPANWHGALLSMIEWRRFEALVEALFSQAGFETKSQSHGADGGVDIWLFSRHEPGRAVSVVQCKHWSGKRVGVDKVRELRGVMAAHGVSRGQFATTSAFTADARAFARGNGINLLDAEALLDLIRQRTPEQQRALIDVAFDGEYWRPTCVGCGRKMDSKENSKDGSRFWGCSDFPRCRHTLPMRG